ncbi:uncharacterized protein CPAR2_504130 [Candida parapsilosis]|uniref:DUF4484 domain-containing protein n=1 Tax=Candida parapsilosis (strain CDC 317 / ATCC MYA-4646) TaxID=578454 RepID=G8BH41_CANPC|nr:uncharacterized protein CPAR2_504130 [Candida parapsilosis]CAD1813366.1 unnamed protein product [Candida parapsilosis]CCE44189.1 hypothetical protein CPAR2_504130 [Candida parapsilosis]
MLHFSLLPPPAAKMTHERSKVVAVFFTEFDMKSGYKLLWSSTSKDVPLEGIEYKSFPSGIHDLQEATVFLSHESGGNLFYGLSCFKQFVIDQKKIDDRDNLKMYSVGIICEPKQSTWKANEFINNGWEYIEELKSVLNDLEREIVGKNEAGHDVDLMKFIEKNLLRIGSEPSTLNIPETEPAKGKHLLLNLPQMFETLGPLIFAIYKQSLLRKNILIFNELHLNNGDDTQTTDKDNYSLLSSFSYLLAILSVVPKSAKLPSPKLHSQQPLYNIGLNELSSKLLQRLQNSENGYIAVTSDEILKDHSIYDIAVEIGDTIKVFDRNKSGIKATIRDYHKFQVLYSDLVTGGSNFTNKSNVSTDDLSSVTSRTEDDDNSIHSSSPVAAKMYANISPRIDNEPSWWQHDAVEPVSWTESIWSAFSWFASAGQQLNIEEESPDVKLNKQIDLLDLLHVVGYFHQLTSKWLNYIDEAIEEEEAEHRNNGNSEDEQLVNKVELHLTYQDMVDMELDPYSHQDVQFLKEFAMQYYPERVESVDVGYNLSNICC